MNLEELAPKAKAVVELQKNLNKAFGNNDIYNQLAITAGLADIHHLGITEGVAKAASLIPTNVEIRGYADSLYPEDSQPAERKAFMEGVNMVINAVTKH